MVSSRYFALFSVLLGSLSGSALAESPDHYVKRAAALDPRQRVCLNPGWIIACPGDRPCIPPGAICCVPGRYVIPPNTCPDGTSPLSTAVVSEPAPTTEAPPVSTPPPVVEYTWYTYRITYTYFWYYYTYFAASYSLTSSETLYFTTVSLTATDEVEASSLFSSLSATLSYAIPTQTATSTYSAEPVPTGTGTTVPYPTGNNTNPTSTPPPFTGAAISLHAGMSSSFSGIFLLIGGALMVMPGLLMVWL